MQILGRLPGEKVHHCTAHLQASSSVPLDDALSRFARCNGWPAFSVLSPLIAPIYHAHHSAYYSLPLLSSHSSFCLLISCSPNAVSAQWIAPGTVSRCTGPKPMPAVCWDDCGSNWLANHNHLQCSCLNMLQLALPTIQAANEAVAISLHRSLEPLFRGLHSPSLSLSLERCAISSRPHRVAIEQCAPTTIADDKSNLINLAPCLSLSFLSFHY